MAGKQHVTAATVTHATTDELSEAVVSVGSVQRIYKESQLGPIFSSEKMLHKGYYRKSSVEKKISGRGYQGA
jgi:hypothetical protein